VFLGSKHHRFTISPKNDDVWCVRMGGRGKRTYKMQTFLNPSLQKSSASYFLNLALFAREARGTPKMHWLSLPPTKESQYQNASVQELVPMMVKVYRAARTYFQSQSD
jgi:hypothetical protein